MIAQEEKKKIMQSARWALYPEEPHNWIQKMAKYILCLINLVYIKDTQNIRK